MRIHWERLGIFGPVYGFVGRGLSNEEIAGRLNISEDNVCQWMSDPRGSSFSEDLTEAQRTHVVRAQNSLRRR